MNTDTRSEIDERGIIDDLKRNERSNKRTVKYYCKKYKLTTDELLAIYSKMIEERRINKDK